MKNTKLAASLLAVSMLATTVLAGCDNTTPNDSGSGNSGTNNSNSSNSSNDSGNSSNSISDRAEWKQTLSYESNVELRMACGYNSADTGMSFSAKIAGEGIKLADGNTYHTGDLKPTWVAVEKKLNIKIKDLYEGDSAANTWKKWADIDNLGAVDFIAGSAATLSAEGPERLLNIGAYLDYMPYFKSYLERNPIVRLSITGDTANGAIYFSPYFDGVDDIERMPLMRVDWVEKLLNNDDEITNSGTLKTPVYQPYMPTSGSVEVDVVKADGSGTEKVKKDYSKYGNIVDKMNAAGTISGAEAVKMLREYIDKTYDGYYAADKRADLFVGQNAAWDADELVALLRCVVANADLLNGGTPIQGIFSRETENTRQCDMFRLAAVLFGVRGLESRQGWLYVGSDNKLHDCRLEEDTYKALERMYHLNKEGLISDNFMGSDAENGPKVDSYLKNDSGFMEYDYSQTQTIYNENGTLGDGEKFCAVMIPVAYWNDGSGNKLMRFTESWRSVKTDAWAISLEGVGYSKDKPAPSDATQLTDKAKALLTLIDYAYSFEGQVLMSYGPDDFIKKNSSGEIEYFDFNGEKWPVISDQNYKDLWSLAKGNYTNYARYYIGSTLSFVKSQAFEYQCTATAGKEGAKKISTAIALGVINHPKLAINSDNMWYTSVPTTLPGLDTKTINTYADLTNKFSTSSSKNGKAQINKLIDIIRNGFGEAGFEDAAKAANTVSEGYSGKLALILYNEAWEDLLGYYESL